MESILTSREYKNKKTIYSLVLTGLLIGITLFLGFSPFGFINIGPISITTITIPILLGIYLLNFFEALLIMLIFCILSFFQAQGASGLNGLFADWRIAFLPRIYVFVMIFAVFTFFKPYILKTESKFQIIWFWLISVMFLFIHPVVIACFVILFVNTTSNTAFINFLEHYGYTSSGWFILVLPITAIFSMSVIPLVVSPIAVIYYRNFRK